jgi:ion channel-forming bestrophin family protein
VSRSFASSCKAYLGYRAAKDQAEAEKIRDELRGLLNRHIAWLYALKHAMWKRTPWEHQYRVNTWYRKYFEKKLGYNTMEQEVEGFISREEMQAISKLSNAPVHLLDLQSQHLSRLYQQGLLDDFRQMELQRLIGELYDEQGKSERLKNTPLPRQYATTSTIFIVIFIVMLPFGMITEFNKLGEGLIWLLIPFNLVVSWVFSLMEYVGDYSENPFEGLVNDVPVMTIVRNIEIDLREMMGDKNVPERVQPVMDVLM